jgi:hypothetical protein
LWRIAQNGVLYKSQLLLRLQRIVHESAFKFLILVKLNKVHSFLLEGILHLRLLTPPTGLRPLPHLPRHKRPKAEVSGVEEAFRFEFQTLVVGLAEVGLFV